MTTATAPDHPAQRRQRADIPAEFRWDFRPIYADWAAWDAGMQDMERRAQDFAALKGTLAAGPAAVLKAWQDYDEIGKLQYRLYRYPQLQRDVDTRNSEVSARFQRVTALFTRFEAATAWFTPELLTIPQATMEQWLDATPALAPYRFTLLDNYRRQAHVLDEPGERLLSLAGRVNGNPREVYSELTTSDIRFPTLALESGEAVTLSPARYAALLEQNPNQHERRAAAEAHLGAYRTHLHTYAALYNGVLQRDWFMAQARRFETTLDAALDTNAIPPAVVETLIQTARAGTAPLQRYLRLKRRLLGLDEFHLYDNFQPLFRTDKRYPYDQARAMALASVAPLGDDYLSRYRRFVGGGRIDVYESEGKRSGAYSAGVYGVGPYLLLNYNDTLDSVFTFAHEAGHAMHTVLSCEHQPFVTSDYTIFVAEVASITNERLLLDELVRRTEDPEERFLLLQHAADSIIGTFYTQTLFADFELQAHRRVEQGEAITPDVLDELYGALLQTYYGDAIVHDSFYRHTWARIPHFFNSPYYVYQYATCFASSAQVLHAMTTGSAAERAQATARYLELLSSGGNDHPMAQLQRAGIDLTQRATVQAVVDQLDELVARMEVEAGRIAA